MTSMAPSLYYRRGLNPIQVEQARQRHGSNALTQGERSGFFKQFLASFGDPIIKVLLCALAINIVFLFRDFDWFETVGIAVAIQPPARPPWRERICMSAWLVSSSNTRLSRVIALARS